MMMLTTVNVQLTDLFFTFPLYCMPHFVHIYIPDVHMYGVSVSLILHHGLVADVVCTSSMTMLTTLAVIVQLTYLFFTSPRGCTLCFAHLWTRCGHLCCACVANFASRLVVFFVCTSSMMMLTTVNVQLTYFFLRARCIVCPILCIFIYPMCTCMVCLCR